MIFAVTPRLTLRALEKSDLPRIVDLIGDWDVARWLVSVPHPYTMQHAEEFYGRMTALLQRGIAEYFLIEQKKDRQQVGAIGLHPSREASPQTGEMVVGYWLGRDSWGQGIVSEALAAVIELAFQRPDITLLTSTTDPANEASQKVLRKAGFTYLGTSPHSDSQALRGSTHVTRWHLRRADYEHRKTRA